MQCHCSNITQSVLSKLQIISKAYDLYTSAYWYSLLDSVELGISYACELSYCSEGVGPYGKVNEDGYITQDAMLMDG